MNAKLITTILTAAVTCTVTIIEAIADRDD